MIDVNRWSAGFIGVAAAVAILLGAVTSSTVASGEDVIIESRAGNPIREVSILKRGDRGGMVLDLQKDLDRLGYLIGMQDGIYGDLTELSVELFQRDWGIKVDGIAGPATRKAIDTALISLIERRYEVERGDTLISIAARYGCSLKDLISFNNINDPDRIEPGDIIKIPSASGSSRGRAKKVGYIHWDEARKIYRDKATVIDVKTGLSFKVRRRSGHHHADSEPLTSADTEIMRKIYGGRWSWERRAIIVVVGDYYMAGSMNGMPHGGESIVNNGFNGHFCIHFYGSRIHASGKIDPDHQAMIKRALSWDGSGYF